MKARIVAFVGLLTFNRVRGHALKRPSLRWWWTPWTYYFGAGGWVYLSRRWLWEKFTYERARRRREGVCGSR